MACQDVARPVASPAISLPLAFVILWSSGYIGGAIGLRYAEPFTMTFLRFSIAGAILLLIALATRAPWPESWRQAGHIAVAGFLVQAVQFGGLYAGMKQGVPAGVAALIVGLMPILTAFGAGRFLGERVSWRQWCGLALGLSGVVVVLADRLASGGSPAGFLLVGLALLGITAGTLYQKRFCAGMDLRTGSCIQLAAGGVVLLAMAAGTETMAVSWTLEFAGSLAWLAAMNSIGAISMLFLMIRRGEASRVAGLFHLVPPTTAAMASFVLGEIPAAATFAGFALAASGVYIGTRDKEEGR